MQLLVKKDHCKAISTEFMATFPILFCIFFCIRQPFLSKSPRYLCVYTIDTFFVHYLKFLRFTAFHVKKDHFKAISTELLATFSIIFCIIFVLGSIFLLISPQYICVHTIDTFLVHYIEIFKIYGLFLTKKAILKPF